MFRIRHAAKLAGINPTLLRAWERRYKLVSPQRTESGYRVYTDRDVEVLRAAARLVDAGHTISAVARLPAPDLIAAAAGLELPAAPPPGPEAAPAIDEALTSALGAIAAFDRRGFDTALFPLTALAGLGPVALCENVLLPLLRRIGDEWEQGRLSVAAEHFGSALCRARILQCLEFVARAATGPRVVCACPDNEQHEGGLLAFSVHAAAAQWQVVYLGAHTPLDQALETAVRIAADLIALSMTTTRSDHEITRMLGLIAHARQSRPGLRVVVGGREAMAHKAELERAQLEVAASITVDLPVEAEDKKRTR